MICLLSQSSGFDKLEGPRDPPDYRPPTNNPARRLNLDTSQMAEVVMAPNPPQYNLPGANSDLYGVYSHNLQPLSSSYGRLISPDDGFLGAAIGQKRFRPGDEFSYHGVGAEASTAYSTQRAKILRPLDTTSAEVSKSREVTCAPLDEVVKKAIERSPAGHTNSPSYTQEFSSELGKHSDVSTHLPPSQNEGAIFKP